jgi:EAL domain-containing protein (putative c-di-GMP-specific phosphodiesterase class I)
MPADGPIRVVLVDDHAMILESLVRAIEQDTAMNVVGTAASAGEGIRAVRSLEPDVAVFDYHLPDGDGANAARQIADMRPGTKVILLTGSAGESALFEASRAGCSGYLEKTRPARELVNMIRRVHAGEIQLPTDRLDELPALDQLAVHYQPIVNLGTREIVGFEALVRWAHPSRGLLAPAAFLALAEQTPLIIDIGESVRQDACRRLVEWSRQPAARSLSVNVNLSGRELQVIDLRDRIGRVLDDTGLEADSLVIELTETFFVEDKPEHAVRLEELKGLGVRIALDDFGTGYSSLSYLRRFPIDMIKLDRSFTAGLPDDTRAIRLMNSVARLAADMGAVTLAEGIETEAQADCLLSLGWQLGQGYYFSRPMAPEGARAAVMAGHVPGREAG